MTRSLLARNLSKLRSFNRLNQGALAEALGVTRNKIASYESQNIEPKLDLLTKISALFRVSVDDLIGTEINQQNYESLTKRYLAWHKGLVTAAGIETEVIDGILDREIIIEFIKENEMIQKMVEGMKAFYDFKNQNSMLSAESQQLMFVLDHLMEANKRVLVEFKKLQKIA
jgi:transcriptional regulator with XRE-family HTH domain